MATLLGHTTEQFSTPYLTIAEYKQAPTAIDYNNLVVASSDPAVQDAELANVIARASSWIDVHCNQVLAATEETEQQRSRIRPDGSIIIHPRYSPLVALLSLSYGSDLNQLQDYPDVSKGWLEDQSVILPNNVNYTSQGALQFGIPVAPRRDIFVRYTYVSGYANTLLASSVSSGASSVTVKSASGIMVGSWLTVYDGLSTENVQVASTYTYGSTTVPLVSPLAYAHASGVAFSALPPAVKQAAILATTAFIKVRGDTSLVMDVINTPLNHGRGDTQRITSDLSLAEDLLKPFRRIR